MHKKNLQVFILAFFIVFINTSKADEISSRSLTSDDKPERTKDLKSNISDYWISEEEYSKYISLKAGIRGVISSGQDPISTLGIEEEDDAKRRHYAELWVKQEYERTEKELKFQREVDEAWKRLMPNILPVNMGNAAGIAHDSGGRLALFVREADCQRCDARLSAVLGDKRPVDIYLVDSEGSDQKLRNWAQQHRIPAEQVRERRITLNHDAGRWMRYGNGIMPVLLQQGKADGISQRSNRRFVVECRQLCGDNQHAKRALGLSESRAAARCSS